MQLSTTFGVLLLTTVYLCNYLVSSQGYCNGAASNCGTRCNVNSECTGGVCEFAQTPCGSSSESKGSSSTYSTSSKSQENGTEDPTDEPKKTKFTTGYIVFAVISILVGSIFVFAVFKWSTIPRRNPHEVKDSI